MKEESNPHHPSKSGAPLVRTLAKGLRILDVLKDCGSSTLTEIARECELDKSTAYRLLGTLEELGFVERSASDDRYCLGLKLVLFGRSAISDLPLRRIALPHLIRLRELSGETASLAVLNWGKVLWIEIIEGLGLLPMAMPAGLRLSWPHATASGKAMLAYLPEQEAERTFQGGELPALTEKTITTVGALREELNRTRERGYALDDNENIVGLRCIGAPIFGSNDEVAGAVSISAPSVRFTEEYYLPLIPALKGASMDISRAMGASEHILLAALGNAPMAG